MKNWSVSPYINRFLSADTVVPSYANPQSLNRFSYVLNNPLRFTDPTGHWADDGYVGNHNKMDCAEYSQYCSNGKPKSADELRKMRNKKTSKNQQQDLLTGFADLFLKDERIDSFGGPIELDPAEFEELLSLIGSDLRTKPPESLPFIAMSYDTPFYNHGGQLSGTGCINGKCYDRSEINYIAEGELWAATGTPKPVGHFIVGVWKGCPFICGHAPGRPSQGTIEMFDIGYDHYKESYPPGTPRAPYLPIMPWQSLGGA